jgi:uroporphyrinogen-III synthase
MIPKIIPPLTDCNVLVTRPEGQAQSLCEEITRLGGRAFTFPTIAIEPITAAPAEACDLVVFVSVNAVAHGKHLLNRTEAMRVAAIGRATAAALREAEIRVDFVPESGFTSESLLAHPDLHLQAGMRALIVRGEGGRELLKQSFEAAGLNVQLLEVYRRTRPALSDQVRDAHELLWHSEGIDVVTLTSVATLDHLFQMVTERGRVLVRQMDAVVASPRLAEAARAAGMTRDILIASGADDASLIGALAQWRMRARG